MRNDIREIKKCIDKCWKLVDELIQSELENLDKQMNELIIKKFHETDPKKISEYEKQLKKLNESYIDLFLSKSDEISMADEVEDML